MNQTQPQLRTHEFKLILLGINELTPEITEKLGAAGLDDAYLIARKGVVTAEFERDADSFQDAVKSAIADIEQADAGVTGFRLVYEDAAVGASEIARRIGKTRQTVNLYASGKRGPGGFPRPVSDNNGEPVYSWADVAGWLEANGMLPHEMARDIRARDLMYRTLESQYLLMSLVDMSDWTESEREIVSGFFTDIPHDSANLLRIARKGVHLRNGTWPDDQESQSRCLASPAPPIKNQPSFQRS